MYGLWDCIIAFSIAGFVTYLEVDRTFYFPEKLNKRAWLYFWICLFVMGNGGLAVVLYITLVTEFNLFSDWSRWSRAAVVGAGYLALARQKFTSYSTEASEFPLGFELVYQLANQAVYKRINRIASQARYEETIELASREGVTVTDLKRRCELSIRQDALLSSEARDKQKQLIQEIINDADLDEETKKWWLAGYVLSQQRSQ
ncbi:MAG: hypothetical protein AAGG02_13760 [Cyanobacteria bacterium P01_H01_bin.15]